MAYPGGRAPGPPDGDQKPPRLGRGAALLAQLSGQKKAATGASALLAAVGGGRAGGQLGSGGLGRSSGLLERLQKGGAGDASSPVPCGQSSSGSPVRSPSAGGLIAAAPTLPLPGGRAQRALNMMMGIAPGGNSSNAPGAVQAHVAEPAPGQARGRAGRLLAKLTAQNPVRPGSSASAGSSAGTGDSSSLPESRVPSGLAAAFGHVTVSGTRVTQPQDVGSGSDRSTPSPPGAGVVPAGAVGGYDPGALALNNLSSRARAHQSQGQPREMAGWEKDQLEDQMRKDRWKKNPDATEKHREGVIRHKMEPNESDPKINLAVNYVRIKCAVKEFHQYYVDCDPPQDSPRVITTLIHQQTELLGEAKVFSGSTLVMPTRLPDKVTVLTCYRKYNDPSMKSEPVYVSLKHVKSVSSSSGEAMQILNILFRRIMRDLDMVPVGRHNYDGKADEQRIKIPKHKLEIWPGYVTSISEADGGLLLLLDVSHRVMRTDTVLDVLYNLRNRSPRTLKDDCLKELVGSVVLTRYNNKTYKIDGIDWQSHPTDTFLEKKSGKMISYIEYYKKQYTLTITDPLQPLLMSYPKKLDKEAEAKNKELGHHGEVIALIPELCCMTGLNDRMRQDFTVMKDLAAHTRVVPSERARSLESFIRRVKGKPAAHKNLTDWKMDLDEKLCELQGAALPIEKVYFGNGNDGTPVAVSATPKAQWMTDRPVLTAVPVREWLLVYPRLCKTVTVNFLRMYQQCGKRCGIEVGAPELLEYDDRGVAHVVDQIKQSMHPQLKLVVVVVPTKREDRYNALKKLFCENFVIPSQIIVSKTITAQHKLKAVSEKIALQINVKVGGDLWYMHIPTKLTLMVLGVDVYHEGVGGGARSVAAVVGSTNPQISRYYSEAIMQKPGEELIPRMKEAFRHCLMAYHDNNGHLPDIILVFRDGVGDSVFGVVQNFELGQLVDCLSEFKDDYNPQICFVIVQKRINTRLFAKGQMNSRYNDPRSAPSGSLSNPPPGTVVDRDITRLNLSDFFLVSQHVTQGTVTPTHYVIIFNTTKWKAAQVQRMAYKMCHMYYNWPGTIRVPAQCQYAHKMAYFVGQTLRAQPHKGLLNRLFYL